LDDAKSLADAIIQLLVIIDSDSLAIFDTGDHNLTISVSGYLVNYDTKNQIFIILA